MMNKWALTTLIISSHLLLIGQEEVSSKNSRLQKPMEESDRIQLKPLYAPDPSYSQVTPTNKNNSNQTNDSQKDSPEKTKSQTLIQPEKWLLESSLNNAPKLLKGIFAYLQSRPRANASQYSIIVPSFHRFILVGPPGSGKTTLAHAIGHMLGYAVIFVAATSFLGRYRNETSVNITRFLREHASMGLDMVIIIDELHKLFEHHSSEHSDDSQTAAAFWLTLDNIEKYNQNVIIIGTANNVDKLPPEIKSRFSGKIITLSLPDSNQKIAAFKNSIANDQSVTLHTSVNDAFIAEMFQKINNCSLRDVRLIIDTAKMFYYTERPVCKNTFPIMLKKIHFQQALKQLQAESQILQESTSDKFYKRLRQWGLIFSVAVNISTLAKASAELYNKTSDFLQKM